MVQGESLQQKDPASQADEIVDRSVYAQDGRFLGKAKAIHEGWFKVDAPRALDYWLPLHGIRAIVHEQVLLNIDTATVRKLRRHEPPTMAERRRERELEDEEAEVGLEEDLDERDPNEDGW